MTTAEAIEGITDAGSFEILATQILRTMDSDCRLIEHFGVNAGGKTIPNPIDGFSQIPGSAPPRFIMTTFTTVEADGLGQKWLSDGKIVPDKGGTREKEGDLVKAGRLSNAILERQPDATVIVYLCTNKRLNEHLMSSAYVKAAALKVEVRFLAQSNIRDFLDSTPGGQWLRKVYLGIAANRISAPLLRELGKQSLAAYGRETLLLSPDQFVGTKQDAQIQEALWNSGTNLIALSGESGSGKSVLAYKAFDHALSDDKFGLWIPGEIALNSNSLGEAVQKTLLLHYPLLEPTAGADSLALSSHDAPLLIVIDDINRSINPLEALRKITAWSKPAAEGETDVQSAPWRILCPLWEQYARARGSILEYAKRVQIVSIARMDINEAEACFRSALGQSGPQLQSHAVRDLARQLNCDPILLVIAAANLAANRVEHPVLAEIVIGNWIEDALSDPQLGSQMTIADHRRALQQLVSEMIRKRVLYPSWEEILEWFKADPNIITSLRDLNHQGRVCRITAGDVFEFRHDRILGHYIVQALTSMIQGEIDSNQPWADPYFRRWLGQAIARSPLSDTKLDRLLKDAPGAVFAALSLFYGRLPEQDQKIDSLCRKWFTDRTGVGRAYSVASVFQDVCNVLKDGVYPGVVGLTDCIKDNPLIQQVRMVAGDVRGAIHFLSDQMRFYPHQRQPKLEEQLKRAGERFGPEMSRELSEILLASRIDNQFLFGAFVLAGYLENDTLLPALRHAWQQPGADDHIVAAFWAAIRCSRATSPEFLLDVLKSWSGRTKEDRTAIGGWWEYNIFREDTDPDVLALIFTEARKDPNVRYSVAWAVRRLDKPSAVCFVSEVLGELEGRAKKAGGFHHWGSIFRDAWDVHKGGDSGNNLSAESKEALRLQWQNREVNDDVREAAFETWVKAALNCLQLRLDTIEPAWETTLYWRRALLGDPEVVDFVKQKLETNQRWLFVVPSIWHPSLTPVLDEKLRELGDSENGGNPERRGDGFYELSNVLRDIPDDVTLPLLKKHWDHLKASPRFVQLALYLCTPETMRLAKEAILGSTEKEALFQHVENFFGFFTIGRMERITILQLAALLEWLPFFDDLAVATIVDSCVRNGRLDWAEQNLKSECERRREATPTVDSEKDPKKIGRIIRVFPTEDDLFDELDKIETEREPGRHAAIYVWIDNFSRRPVRQEQLWNALDSWLKRSPTAARLAVVAEAIEFGGDRSRLPYLTRYPITGPPEYVDEIITNTTFVVKSRTLN